MQFCEYIVQDILSPLFHQKKIPLYKPQNVVGEEVFAEIISVLKSGWLTSGPETEKFETIFSNYIGCKYGVATNSCTSALYLALDALQPKKGDQVVVPVLTFVATANVVKWVGAEPIFCDVAEDGEIDTEKLEDLLETNDKKEYRLWIEFMILADGKSQFAKIINTDIELKDAEECIREKIQNWRFTPGESKYRVRKLFDSRHKYLD